MEIKKRMQARCIIINKQSASIVFFIIILTLLAGFREIGFDRDSLSYATTIQSIDFSSFSNLDFSNKEPSFYLINYIAYWLFGDAVRGTFIIYAFLGVTLKMIGIYRLSRIPILSIILYLSCYYLIQEMTMIRAGVATGIFLLAIPDIANRDFKAYLGKSIIAALFHTSAIIMLPLYLILSIKIGKWFYLVLPIFGMILSALLNDLIQNLIIKNIVILNLIPTIFSHKLVFYLEWFQRGVFTEYNFFSLYYLSWMIIYYFCIINIRRFKSDIDIILVKILGISLFNFYALSFLPVLAYRISEISGVVLIILLPSIVYIFKQYNRLTIIYLIFIYSLINLVNILYIQDWF